MFLSKQDIVKRADEIFANPAQFDPSLIKEASYDLCVGDEVFLSENQVPQRLSEGSPYVVLPPGQFALIKTFEEIIIPPDLIGFLSIRSRFKFQGLINISGFHVDPTYRGHLIFSVQNVGPNDIRLEYKHPTFMLMLAELRTHAKEPRKDGFQRIPLEYMAQLGGRSVTLAKLKQDIDHLSVLMKIYAAIAVPILVGIIGALLKWWFKS